MSRHLANLRVIEIAGSLAGAYCGKLFSDYGATVTRIVELGGPQEPVDNAQHDDMSAANFYTNTGKRLLALDVHGQDGLTQLRHLVGEADVLIESAPNGPLTPAIGDAYPELVHVLLSPFGAGGPYSSYRSSPFIDFALSGHMYLTGDRDKEPLQGPPCESHYASGTYAFIGAMAALWARMETHEGQSVDISHFEAMASLHQYTTVMWTHGQHIQGRVGNRQPGPWHPNGHLPCRDGYISISAPGAERRERMLAVLGLTELLEDPRFADEVAFLQHLDEFDAAIGPRLLESTAEELSELLTSARVPAAPVRSLGDVLAYEHLRERGFWQEMSVGTDPVQVPRGPFIVNGQRPTLQPPEYWQADEQTVTEQEASASCVPASSATRIANGPLTEIRVLDLTTGWAGPLAGRILGDMGADVIRVEPPWARGAEVVTREAAAITHMFPDDEPGDRPWNRQGMINKLARNRRTVAVRMDTPEGLRVVERLVQSVDVVLENFSPRVMPNLGLTFNRLGQLNPRIVYVHLPGFGSTGPDMNQPAFGPIIEAAAGGCTLLGYEGSGPQRQGMAFPDAISGVHGAAAVLLGLWMRVARPGGEPVEIEAAQLETTLCFEGDALIAHQLDTACPVPLGNRSALHAPQGVYRCRGSEQWIAVSVQSDEQWERLCHLAGLPDTWRGLAVDERRRRHDEIDERLRRWCVNHGHLELMHALQRNHITAGAVLNGRELVEDPHLDARSFFVTLSHPDSGSFPFPGLPIHFSQTPATYRIGSPGLGEYNEEVLVEVGYSEDEIKGLYERGIIANAPG